MIKSLLNIDPKGRIAFSILGRVRPEELKGAIPGSV